MKKHFLYLILVCSLSTQAQEDKYIKGFVGLGGGWVANSYDMSSLNTMLENYNSDYNGDFSPFNNLSHGYGFKLTYGANMNHFVFHGTWSWNKTTQRNEYIRKSNYGRAFEFKARDTYLIFGAGYGNNLLRITGDFGMGYRLIDVTSAEIFPDESISYSSNNYLNGVFQSSNIPLYFGLTADFKIDKWIHIQASANLNTVVFEGDGLQGLLDTNDPRFPAYEELPLSHKDMYDKVSSGILLNSSNYVSGVFQGFQFSVTAFFTLSFYSEN